MGVEEIEQGRAFLRAQFLEPLGHQHLVDRHPVIGHVVVADVVLGS